MGVPRVVSGLTPPASDDFLRVSTIATAAIKRIIPTPAPARTGTEKSGGGSSCDAGDAGSNSVGWLSGPAIGWSTTPGITARVTAPPRQIVSPALNGVGDV